MKLLRFLASIEQSVLVFQQRIDLRRNLAHACADVQVLAEFVLLELVLVVLGCQLDEERGTSGRASVVQNFLGAVDEQVLQQVERLVTSNC